jgi:hypothetical protein
METLPWELIGIIGDNLLPMWRCRLYMCNKLWYLKHYNGLSKWRKCITNTLNEIAKIKYKYCDYHTDHSYIQYSTRRYNGAYISYIYMYTYKEEFPPQKLKLVTTFNTGNREYTYNRCGSGCIKAPLTGPIGYICDVDEIMIYREFNEERKQCFDLFNRRYNKDTGFIIKNI